MTLAAAAWVVTMTVCRGECPVKLSPCSSCWCEMRVRVMCVRANRVMRVAHENTHTARARARAHTHTQVQKQRRLLQVDDRLLHRRCKPGMG